MARETKVPGVTTKPEEQTTAEKANDALEQITTADNSNTELTSEELLREELALAQAQIAELKKSTQVVASASGGAPTQPKKRIPVLTKDGWTTKEAD